jgi:hypothetical protein
MPWLICPCSINGVDGIDNAGLAKANAVKPTAKAAMSGLRITIS